MGADWRKVEKQKVRYKNCFKGHVLLNFNIQIILNSSFLENTSWLKM